jgi:TetR/AcrR family transcriptional regulator, transcriptional repressor for nem operon
MALRDPDKTRLKLLSIAANLFQKKGYNGTSLSDIINEAEVSKGALYHHFANKNELLYSVIDELYRERFLSPWRDVIKSQDPIQAIENVLHNIGKNADVKEMCNGCPVHNVLAELGATDEGVRLRINQMHCDAQKIICDALEISKDRNIINKDVDSNKVSLFFMCGINGMPQLVTSCQNVEVFQQLTDALADYIRSFKMVD